MSTRSWIRSLGTDTSVPFYRNIYVLAFFVGALILTLIRPFLRHEPEPPPVLRDLPDVQLRTSSGAAVAWKQREGKVTVLSLFEVPCRSGCQSAQTALSRLQERFAREKIDVTLYSLSVAPSLEIRPSEKDFVDESNKNVTFLFGKNPELREFLTALEAHNPKSERVSNVYEDNEPISLVVDALQSTLFLMDSSGRLRGRYASSEAGQDEVFHRTLHVVKEERSRAK
jgi:cytochrome oxidase Cu insertion factor (SCO1/SenC/PrrC family)